MVEDERVNRSCMGSEYWTDRLPEAGLGVRRRAVDPVSHSGRGGHRNSASKDIYGVGTETRKKMGSQTVHRSTWALAPPRLATVTEATVGGSVFGR